MVKTSPIIEGSVIQAMTFQNVDKYGHTDFISGTRDLQQLPQRQLLDKDGSNKVLHFSLKDIFYKLKYSHDPNTGHVWFSNG